MANLKSRIDKLETKAGGDVDAAKIINELARKRREEGEALKAWREKLGYSEEQAAKELGVEHDPSAPYRHGAYRPMESGEGMTNSVRAVIGIKPDEPWSADGQIRTTNAIRERHISMGLANVELLSAAEEEQIRKSYASELLEYERDLKAWEENTDGKH